MPLSISKQSPYSSSVIEDIEEKMAAAVGRGAQTMNSMYFKPMLRKAYHRKNASPDMASDSAKLNAEEVKNRGGNHDGNQWWIPDHRTGIYYPKGHEKVIAEVPLRAGKDFGVNWFSNHENRGS